MNAKDAAKGREHKPALDEYKLHVTSCPICGNWPNAKGNVPILVQMPETAEVEA